MINSYLNYLQEEFKSKSDRALAHRHPKKALIIAQTYSSVKPFIMDICSTMDKILKISLDNIPNSRLDYKRFEPYNMQKVKRTFSEGYKVIYGPRLYSIGDDTFIDENVILKKIESNIIKSNSRWELAEYKRFLETIGTRGLTKFNIKKDLILCYVKQNTSKLLSSKASTVLASVGVENVNSQIYRFKIIIPTFGVNV